MADLSEFENPCLREADASLVFFAPFCSSLTLENDFELSLHQVETYGHSFPVVNIR